MTRRVSLTITAAIILVGLAAGAVLLVRRVPTVSPIVHPPLSMAVREQRAKARFLREHPGQQPRNVAIGRAAMALHAARPMGKFVLGLGADDKGNDCSDFVNCAIDEGLGFKARFKRRSDRHVIGNSLRVQYEFFWNHKTPLLPGDGVTVRHSPWYDPYPGACWHMGIVGADGYVYDFVKLKIWNEPKYGRHELAWFVQHAPGPQDVLVRRLLPEYRYGFNNIEGNAE